MKELIEKCKWTSITLDNVAGFQVKGPNGNSIFLPKSGFKNSKGDNGKESYAYYWTSTLYIDETRRDISAYNLKSSTELFNNERKDGMPVRPVLANNDMFSLAFVADGKTIVSKEIERGEKIVIPEAPTKEGYTFITWGAIPTYMPGKNSSYTAQYSVNKYTITYLVDEDIFHVDTLEYNADVIIPDTIPLKANHKFESWGNVVKTMPSYDLIYTAKFSMVYQNGDVDLDGRINSVDVVSIYNYILNGEASGISVDNADVNADGFVNAADVVSVYNIIINGK